jgi:hypothetical protein
MAAYAGLTDDLERRKVEHGAPTGWKWYGPFATEDEARAWEREMLDAGFRGTPGGAGWRFGYTYAASGVARP